MAEQRTTTEPPKVAKDPNQGEGDRASALKYDTDVEQFVAEDRVVQSARAARAYVDAHPKRAARAERRAKRGPSSHISSVEDLVAKGVSVLDRVVGRLRKALGR